MQWPCEVGGGHSVEGSVDVCNSYCYWMWCSGSLMNVL
jgi:hypothetical protein